jgi:hypothetical protein
MTLRTCCWTPQGQYENSGVLEREACRHSATEYIACTVMDQVDTHTYRHTPTWHSYPRAFPHPHTDTNVRMFVHPHACTNAHMHTNTHTNIPTHAHTHKHVHIHTWWCVTLRFFYWCLVFVLPATVWNDGVVSQYRIGKSVEGSVHVRSQDFLEGTDGNPQENLPTGQLACWLRNETGTSKVHQSQCLRCLRRRCPASCLLRLWVRIPLGAWKFVCYERCVLSRRGLCAELTAHPEESYQLWCIIECDLETLWMRRPWPSGGCRAKNKQTSKVQATPVTTSNKLLWLLHLT